MGSGQVSNPPPPPPGFVIDGLPQKRPTVPPPPAGFQPDAPQPAFPIGLPLRDTLTGQAVDGDTLRLRSMRNLRLYGADAPEMSQQGVDMSGQPLPLGERALANLRSLISVPSLVPGNVMGQSYNRPVAPVTANGVDVAQAQIRSGNALATPRYLANDPERLFQYMQAERLARQNLLGMHQTQFQDPADYRKNPLPIEQLRPERETVPLWWTTPTPLSGMRPDAERQYIAMVNDEKVAPKDVQAFARANGFTVADGEVERVRAQSKKSGQPIGIAYKDAPKVLTDNGDGALGAGLRGIGNGALANFLEEGGAVVDALGGTPGRENVWNSKRRFADIWLNNEIQNEAITGFDKSQHPYATGTGEFAGALAFPAGKVRSAAGLAKWGAVYGGLAGLGTEGTVEQRLGSGAVGAGLGAATSVIGAKLLEAASPLVAKGWRWVRGRSGPELVPPAGSPAAPLTGDDLASMAARSEPLPNSVNTLSEHRVDVPPPPPGFSVDQPEVLRPALMDRSGKIYAGNVGETHADVFNANPRLDFPEERPDASGFVTPDGTYLDRRQALEWVNSRQTKPVVPSTQVNDLDAMDYNAQRAMAGEPGASISQEVRQPDYLFRDRPAPMDSNRFLTGNIGDIQPRDVVPLPSNEVGSVEEAAAIDKGRFAPATAPNERDELTRQTLRAWNGAEVPKVGPVDLVGWLRMNGGLRDQGGELAHMGLTNKARSGMDFVGQEARLGPLVNNESGMTLDDAAMRAWEAGYFPDHMDRPDVNTFLDALRGTQEGWKRHFLPEDFAEIDRFNAARGERQNLAAQRSEVGQVWRDKSVPADEPQPFAPPEAYEEWPAGGPDYAGNINLDKLDTPQDIRRALSQVNNRVGGFDAATRGRITQAETERLAGELGMTPEALLARRKGQALNAEEALAARQMLAKSGNELVNAAKRVQAMENPGDEVLADFQRKLTRHVAIQEQVAGMTAEAGRTLQQFRMMADSRNVRGDVLKSIVDKAGGGRRLQDAAGALLDAVEGDPGKFNVLADKLTKPKWIDKATELRYFMLLSGPQTHVANIVSNTLTALGQFPEHAAASAIGLGRRAVTGKEAAADRVYPTEIGSRAFGFLQGIKEGGQQFLRTLRTGETSDFAGKMEAPAEKAIGGFAGKIVRAPMRALSAEDEVFKAMARHMEMVGLADRKASMEGLKGEAKAKRIADLLTNPPDDMLSQAFDYARYITFQRPLSGIAQTISIATQTHPALKFVIPFVRTPTNLLKFAAERSPLAPLVKEWRADMVAGGARRDLAIAKASVGTGFGLWMADLARQGVITGSPPEDKNKERLLRADGWQPYSVKVGDRYVAYNRLDPFSSTIGIAADLATKADGMTARQLDQYSGLLVASIIKSMGDKTWLSGLSDFFEMANDPQRMGANYLRNQAASFVVPNASAQLARTVDPVRRDTNTLGDELLSRLPYLSKSLPAKRDIWGREITTDRIGPDILSPITTTLRLNDPVNRTMLGLGATATPLPKFHMVDGKRVDYTPKEYDALSARAGQGAYDRIRALLGEPGWSVLSYDAQRKAIQNAVRGARQDARSPALVGAVPAGPPPPPLGFKLD